LGETIELRDAYMNLGHLPLKVSRCDPLAEQFQVAHFGFDKAVMVVDTLALSDAASQAVLFQQGSVTGMRPCAVLFPGLVVLANRNERRCDGRCDSVIARLTVVGHVAAAQLYGCGLGNLCQQVWQHLRIAEAVAGDANCPDLKAISVYAHLELLPKVLRSVFLGLH